MKMKRLTIILLLMAGCVLTLSAQTDKAERIKEIRQSYAQAQKDMAENGKDGNPALDMCVRLHLVNEVDDDFTIEDDTDISYFFKKEVKYDKADEMYYQESVSYFIIEKWSANGHSRYREMLYDVHTGQLIFAFTKTETHTGFATESRFYFDNDGRLIEQKLKVNGKDTAPDDLSGSTADEVKEVSDRYLSIFRELMASTTDYGAPDGPATGQQKDERMKTIRADYAKAKQLMDDNAKNNGNSLSIVIHDQEEGDSPPTTTELNYSFNEWDDGRAPMYRCYFITFHHHNNMMGFDSYKEFLLNDELQRMADNGKPEKTVNPMFAYTCIHEENEKWEYRYYFDDNGRCIETKSTDDETDGGKDDKETTRRFMFVFNTIMEK